MNTRLQTKIENYHSGRMSSDEASLFESELASDPTLQAESDFQGDIINGLKEYRKSELKARLSAVEIGPAWMEFVQQSTLLKSFGGVAVATLVGTGVYFMAEPDTGVEEVKEMMVDAPEIVLGKKLWDIEPASLEKTGKAPVSIAQSVSPGNTAVTPVVSGEVSSINPVVEEGASEAAIVLDFNAPTAEEIKDEEVLESTSLEALPDNPVAKEEVTPIDVDHENTKAINIKYKYYDGKLFLSGDFDRAPYEILEINSANGRRIYVKYLDKYYRVGITDKLTTLPLVSDVNVIKELQLLRKNK